tara:strand:- start:93 stop:815 length:723 start_codon:yes stop_codon:yes gene_type:complete
MIKKIRNLTGDKIYAKNASWSFDKKVPKTFTKHISKSVPFYQEGHNLICELSDFFLKDNSTCYDLGCSTGTLLNKVKHRHKNKKIKFIGVDSVKKMILQAKKENKKSSVKYFHKDIKKFDLKKNDLIISYYTMQFIKPKFRQTIINRIYKSLNWGGAFIMFEKIRASDARFQDIYSLIYNDFKLKNGFSPNEIISKSRSLKGILEPFSDFGNTGLIKRAGFVDYINIFQWMNFKGYLCIK